MKQRVQYRGRELTTMVEHELGGERCTMGLGWSEKMEQGGPHKESMIIHRIQHTGSRSSSTWCAD
jgi:hypothetical protein